MMAVVRKNSWRKRPNDGNRCAGRKALVVDVVNGTSHSIQDLFSEGRGGELPPIGIDTALGRGSTIEVRIALLAAFSSAAWSPSS